LVFGARIRLDRLCQEPVLRHWDRGWDALFRAGWSLGSWSHCTHAELSGREETVENGETWENSRWHDVLHVPKGVLVPLLALILTGGLLLGMYSHDEPSKLKNHEDRKWILLTFAMPHVA
jgi:hypothetical protein